MSNQTDFTFTIDRNKRHQIQIEEIKVDDLGKVVSDALFTREYEQALGIVKTIMKMQKKPCSRNSEYISHQGKSCKTQNRNNKNNILLFAGQRGGGKTSAVTSFGQYLEQHTVEKNVFRCLPMIDPSYFDNNNNILKSVLTMMFRVATCENLNNTNNNSDNHSYNELWKLFSKAFKTLEDIERAGTQEYSLEILNELGEASNLQETMQCLVQEFIRVSPVKCDCLVLMIDDLDMNVTYAVQMLEQIRKFLMLDHLIILVAANLDQLQNEMREFYSNAFQQTIQYTNSSLSVDVEDLATRYLLKVFPASRRIHLSNITQYLINARLHIVDARESNDNYDEYEGRTLQQVVLTMIWERTRLLFVPKDTNLLHPVIPSNLRDLSQFVNFLLDMGKVNCDAESGKLFKDAGDYIICQQNLTRFKNYFLNNWLPENLTYEEELLFKSTPKDVSEINKHFVNAINVIGTKNKKRLMSREVDLEQIVKYAEDVNIDRDIYTMVSPNDPKFVKANKISDIFNQPSNYSYGDLLLMIDKYETYFESAADRRFIDAVKIYYSIILFETMFFKSVGVKYDKQDVKDINLKTTVPIQRMLGGTVYYPNYFEVVNSEFFKQKGPSFDAKRAFYHKFSYENPVAEIRQLFKERHNITNDERMKLNELISSKISSFREEYRMLLFFVLYYGENRPDRYDSKHIYDTTMADDALVNGKYQMVFDLLSLFNNVLNPLHTIYRSRAEARRNVCDYTKFNKTFDALSKWKGLCSTSNDTVFPGALLPFYSIDMMLLYLRAPAKDVDILANTKALKEQIKDNYDRLNSLSEFVDDYAYNNEWSYKFIRMTIESVLSTENKQYRLPKDIVVELNKNFSILNKAYALYAASLKSDSLIYKDSSLSYQNHVIDIIFKEYKGSSKERDIIIKRIHDFVTISEVYNYLINALWVSVIKERIIKADVQERIRTKSSILNYYNKLWSITEQAINRIKVDKIDEKNGNTEVASVYRSIYQTGVEVFIEGK